MKENGQAWRWSAWRTIGACPYVLILVSTFEDNHESDPATPSRSLARHRWTWWTDRLHPIVLAQGDRRSVPTSICGGSFGGSVNPRDLIDFFQVPGAFEIPLQAKLLARTSRYVAIVAAGLVVDGGIYRHEFVADAVISALMRLQLETDVPIISAVLTPQRFHEHEEHKRFFQRAFRRERHRGGKGLRGDHCQYRCGPVVDRLITAKSASHLSARAKSHLTHSLARRRA